MSSQPRRWLSLGEGEGFDCLIQDVVRKMLFPWCLGAARRKYFPQPLTLPEKCIMKSVNGLMTDKSVNPVRTYTDETQHKSGKAVEV